jgi:lipoprotein-anchoring transpeptidase ErfK/SrfK
MVRMRVRRLIAVSIFAVACGGRAVTVQPSSSSIAAPVVAGAAVTDRDGFEVVRAVGDGFDVYPSVGANHANFLPARNDWHQPLWLPIVRTQSDAQGNEWLNVRLPVRPNGSTGWVRAADVKLRRVHDRIVVDLSERRLWHYETRRLDERLRVAIGKPNTPTTTGHFFVWARVHYDDAGGPYGVFALGLSGFSDVITDWVGGGRLAVHGTDDPRDRGLAVSHGCVRVLNDQIKVLEDVQLGTPVLIHR